MKVTHISGDALTKCFQVATDGVSLKIGRRRYTNDYGSWDAAAAPIGDADEGGQGAGPKTADTYSLQGVSFDRTKFTLMDAMAWLKDQSLWGYDWTEATGALDFQLIPAEAFDPATLRVVDAKTYIVAIKDSGGLVKYFDQGMRLDGVEIFRVGEWNGDDYSGADLDEIVANFDKVGYDVPIKLGHSDEVGGKAFGWVESVRRVGDTLLANFRDVPKQIYDAIKDRAYDAVSSEIFWDLSRGGNTFKRALKAVALLGAETPGVAGLAPLRTVVLRSLPIAGFGACRAYVVHPEEWNMDKIAKLTADLKAATDQVAALSAKLAGANGDAAKITELSAALSTANANVTKLATDLAAANIESAQQMTKLTTDMAALATTVTTLTATNNLLVDRERRALVKEHVAKCAIPAFHGALAALFDLATGEGDKPRVTKFKMKDAAGAEKEIDADATTLLTELVSQINAAGKTVFMHASRVVNDGGVGDRGGNATEYDDPSAEVTKRANEYMTKNNVKSFATASRAVLAADPELATAYANFTTH